MQVALDSPKCSHSPKGTKDGDDTFSGESPRASPPAGIDPAAQSKQPIPPAATRYDLEELELHRTRPLLQAIVEALRLLSGVESVLVTHLQPHAGDQWIVANSSAAGKCVDGATSTTLDESMCKRVFSSAWATEESVREVQDTTQDSLCKLAPLVTGGPCIRYYLGMRLGNSTFVCFLDSHPGRPPAMQSEAVFQNVVGCCLRLATHVWTFMDNARETRNQLQETQLQKVIQAEQLGRDSQYRSIIRDLCHDLKNACVNTTQWLDLIEESMPPNEHTAELKALRSDATHVHR